MTHRDDIARPKAAPATPPFPVCLAGLQFLAALAEQLNQILIQTRHASQQRRPGAPE